MLNSAIELNQYESSQQVRDLINYDRQLWTDGSQLPVSSNTQGCPDRAECVEVLPTGKDHRNCIRTFASFQSFLDSLVPSNSILEQLMDHNHYF